MNLHIVLDPKEVAELKTLLDRALNTLPRQDWPAWVVELEQKVTEHLESERHIVWRPGRAPCFED